MFGPYKQDVSVCLSNLYRGNVGVICFVVHVSLISVHFRKEKIASVSVKYCALSLR